RRDEWVQALRADDPHARAARHVDIRRGDDRLEPAERIAVRDLAVATGGDVFRRLRVRADDVVNGLRRRAARGTDAAEDVDAIEKGEERERHARRRRQAAAQTTAEPDPDETSADADRWRGRPALRLGGHARDERAD